MREEGLTAESARTLSERRIIQVLPALFGPKITVIGVSPPLTSTDQLHKDLTETRTKLNLERQKNYEARQDIQRLKKKANYERKYKILKTDYSHLLNQFQQSE